MAATALAPAPTPSAEAPVAESLAAASRELDHIAALGRQLQDRLSPLLRRSGEAAFEAQALDELVQQAQGLGAFLDRLGEACADDWRVLPQRAAAELGLAAQRHRLSTGEVVAPEPPPGGSGDFELF